MAEQLKILCLTWNIELESPDDAQLKKFFGKVRSSSDHGVADIIVVGIQEGGSRTRYRQILEKALDGFACVAKAKFGGKTKPSQWLPWNEDASQGLYMLVNKDKFGSSVSEAKKDLNAKADDNKKGITSEKGYVFGEITYLDKRIAFVSTHAETKEEKRGADFDTIAKYLAKSAQDQKFHAIFFMGDLNYRMKRTADEAKDKTAFEKEKDEIYTLLSSGAGRKQLMKRDTFVEPHLAGINMEWPNFADSCLATYKRLKADKAKVHLAKLEGDADKYDKAVLKELYPLKASDKGGSNWDFGWLDRIGYADGATGGALLEKGLKLKNAPVLHGGNWVIGGDHIPVFATFTFEVV